MYNRFSLSIIISLIIILMVTGGVSAEPKDTGAVSLSLTDAVEVALRLNQNIRMQQREIEAAGAVVTQSRSNFIPKVDVTGGYTYNDAILNSDFLPESKKDPRIFFGYKDDNEVGLVLNETLFRGGANIAGFKQARLKLKSEEEILRLEKLNLEFEVKRLYYGLLLAYETRRIAQDLVNQAQSHYEDVKRKFQQGIVARFDVLQSKVQVSKLVPELVRAENAVELTKADLKKLIGLNLDDEIILKDRLDYQFIDIREKDFLKEAYESNPEMALQKLGIDVNKLSIQMARAEHRPQINVNAGYNFRSDNYDDMFNDRHSNWSAGVTVTIPIFDGFSTRGKVMEAKARYAQQYLEEEDISQQIAVDIKRACLDLKQAEAIIKSQKDSVKEAREALKIAGVSYASGEGINLDILDAQVSLGIIEKNLSEGIYDYIIARAFLDKTMGREFLKEEMHEGEE